MNTLCWANCTHTKTRKSEKRDIATVMFDLTTKWTQRIATYGVKRYSLCPKVKDMTKSAQLYRYMYLDFWCQICYNCA